MNTRTVGYMLRWAAVFGLANTLVAEHHTAWWRFSIIYVPLFVGACMGFPPSPKAES